MNISKIMSLPRSNLKDGIPAWVLTIVTFDFNSVLLPESGHKCGFDYFGMRMKIKIMSNNERTYTQLQTARWEAEEGWQARTERKRTKFSMNWRFPWWCFLMNLCEARQEITKRMAFILPCLWKCIAVSWAVLLCKYRLLCRRQETIGIKDGLARKGGQGKPWTSISLKWAQ